MSRMRTLIVENKDGQLAQMFNQQELFTVSYQQNLHLLSQLDVQAAIVDQSAVPFALLIEKLPYLQDLTHLFYVVRQPEPSIEDICKAKQIKIVTGATEVEIYDSIKQTVFPDEPKSNQLFLFVGADHKAGTTSVTHSVAQHLAGVITKKVLVVSLNSRTNDTFIEVSKSTIDHLRTSITSRVVTFTEIFRESEKLKSYQFLAGPRDMVRARSYSVEDVINFIEVLRNQDDYIVLIDGGNDIDNPLTIAALQRVKNRFMITKNTQSYYRALDQKVSQVLLPHPALQLGYDSFLYVINGYDETTDSSENIRNRKGLCVATLPTSKYGDSAEEQFTTLYSIDDEYRQKIDVFTNIIASKTGFKREEVIEKPSLLKRLFKGKREEVANGFSS